VRKLECLGDMCPLPLMKLMQCKEQLDAGESVLLVTDHSCTCESIISYCEKQNICTKVMEPIPGIWEITVYKER
jgi:tRNA 2-thiouridine synthesizing protein A